MDGRPGAFPFFYDHQGFHSLCVGPMGAGVLFWFQFWMKNAIGLAVRSSYVCVITGTT